MTPVPIHPITGLFFKVKLIISNLRFFCFWFSDSVRFSPVSAPYSLLLTPYSLLLTLLSPLSSKSLPSLLHHRRYCAGEQCAQKPAYQLTSDFIAYLAG